MTGLNQHPVTRVSVAIVGAGFAGMAAAIKLREAGVHDFLILEAASDVGGTWRDNTYPGAACDVPSHVYSYSFEKYPDWSRAFATQHEIHAYMKLCVAKYGLREYLMTGRAIRDARFDEAAATWTLTAANGERFVADSVVAALGPLRDPAYPNIEGRETFAGVSMHTARWDHGVDLRGKRVGVIGTGASSVQVVPGIADEVETLTVFQRTPPWVLPKLDRPYLPVEKTALRWLPGLKTLRRASLYWQREVLFLGLDTNSGAAMKPLEMLAQAFLRTQVRDPELRAKLTPDYRLGCKRILISNTYLRTLDREHVDLDTSGVARITPTGVVTGVGREVELDVIVYATGFQVDEPLGQMTVTGLGGADLNRTWNGRPTAYLGMTMPNFPNLFIMVGPNTGLGHQSMIFMMESQVAYVVPAIQHLLREDVGYMDVRADALEAWTEEMDRRNAHGVWASGCESWYLGKDRVNFTVWPGSTFEYRWRTRSFDVSKYRVVAPSELPVRRPLAV